MKKTFLLVLLLSLLSIYSCSDRNELASIVYHNKATTNEQLAAKEIQRYIYLRTGNIIEIKTVEVLSDIKNKSIIVGSELSRNILDESDDLGEEGFLLKESGDKLYISGKTDVATLYGAYRFAEILGVRFYLDGDVIPDEKIETVSISGINEIHKPLFETRGLQPFHDFPEGPDWWENDDYKAHFAQMVKMRFNFFGLHTYPENGPHAEPSVWIGLKEDIEENGDVKFSYRTTFANTEREGHWGYAPMKTGDFVAGASLLFDEDVYSNSVLKGLTSQNLSPEQCNELFNRQGRLFKDVFGFGRQFGIKMTVGLETPLVVPQAVQARLISKGLTLGSDEVLRSLYEGIYHRITKAYPIDYFWLWTHEDWTWGNPDKKEVERTFKDIDIAWKTLDELGRPFGFGLCGWVLGPPNNRSAFDNNTPDWVALSCINRYLGFEWVDPGFREIKKDRPKWVIPWLEDDHAMIQPQFWVGRIRRDAADALADDCTGLIGIHWRTKTIGMNIAALSQAGWDKNVLADNSDKPIKREERKRDLPSGDFYSDWISSQFGANMIKELKPIFESLDGGIYIPQNSDIANLPRPSKWDTGPGGMREIEELWEEEQLKYAFVDTLESLRDKVQGKGNLYRFDYWLGQLRYLRQMGKTGCTKGLLTASLNEYKQAKTSAEKEAIKKKLIEVRVELSRDWEKLMTALLEVVASPGEMGNIANLEQHSRSTLQFLTKYDADIEKLTGVKLPEEIKLRKEYQGESRFFVPTVRSLLDKNEKLSLKAIVIDNDLSLKPVVYYRKMGAGEYKSLEMNNTGRGVFEIEIPTRNMDAVEYYFKLIYPDGQEKIWPITAPDISQTVLIQ